MFIVWFSVKMVAILTLKSLQGVILSRLFISKPLALAMMAAFSGSAFAAPLGWENQKIGAICRPPLPKEAAVMPAKKSGEAMLPENVTRIVADKVAGQTNQRHRADGDVIVERNGETLNANWVDYDQPKETVWAGDSFTFTRADGETLTGSQFHYQLDKKAGVASDTQFVAENNNRRLQGVSGSLNMQDENHQTMSDVLFNTCEAGDTSWYVKASELSTNRETGIGVAKHAKLYFAGLPVLYTPWVDFPINGNRKSGFLVPTLSTGSNGATIKLPYYLNLAPNYDATITPGVMTERGETLGAEFRYLQPNYWGAIRGEYMPSDKKSEYKNRYIVRLNHVQNISQNVNFGITYNQASDDDYFRDFSGRNEIAESVNLNRSAWLNYTPKLFGETLNAQLMVQKYQTLRDSNGYKENPYAILPRLSVQWGKHINHADLDVWGQITRFESENSTQQDGVRSVLYPSIKWDYSTIWGFVRPKIGVHATQYSLSEWGSLKSRKISRVLPIANVDSGLIFERETNFSGLFGNNKFVQTLEPRLFYNYIPSKSQNDLPNFDTTLNDFSYSQLFRENIYSGQDRINASNSLSVGVQSRVLNSKTGQEYFRAGFGQKYYLNDDNVLLNGNVDKTPRKYSDFVAFFGGQVAKNWFTDTNFHWSENEGQVEKFDTGVRYNPEPGKVISVRYKYSRNEEIYTGFYDKLKHVDVAAQWPINQDWYAVGRFNYSLKPHMPLEQMIGLEYKNPCGCWSASLVAQRYVSGLKKYDNAVFFTLQLKDVSTLGNSPYEQLRLGIPGYHKTNEVNKK